VEIHRHYGHPLSEARIVERIKDLTDRSWAVLYVWTSPSNPPYFWAAQQTRALYDSANRDRAVRGHYWVIRGGGQRVATSRGHFDDLT
jgi:hypothetical protein